MATDSLVLQKEFGQGVNRSTITQAGSEFNMWGTTGNKYNEIYHIWLEYLVVRVFLISKHPVVFK